MSRFDFLTQHVIDASAIEEVGVREFYLDRTIAQSTINILYAPAGTGKTWMSFALCGVLMERGLEVIYLDNDNGIHLLKDRGWDRFLARYAGRMHYVNADMLDDPEADMKKIMRDLKTNAEGEYFRRVAVVFDSLQFFLSGGMYDENKIRHFNAMCKRIRKSGGTVLVLNHATKNGLVMKGGGSLIDSADEVWQLRAVHADANEKHFVMTPEKRRNGTEEAGYSINVHTMELSKIDAEILNMTETEKECAYAAVSELSKRDSPIAQSDLLRLIGRAPTDKFGNEILKKYDGKLWTSHRDGKRRMYQKMDKK
ncbi:MAG: AAA family ATPase [Campylobacterales bacterium]|nr:AAA family ATPase [Campylobacterales bacterium]